MRLYTRNELKIIAIITAAISIIAVLITFAVMLPRRGRDPVDSDFGNQAVIFLPDVSDLEIPDDFTLVGSDSWIYSRERPKRWTENQIGKFWIEPAEISLEILTAETDAMIQQLMEKIP